jgi:hypothetical protein
MSDHGKHAGHGHAGEPPDEVQYNKVILVGVASLAIFAASIFWASLIWRHKIAETEAATGHAKVIDTRAMPAEIGIVDQVPFVIDHRLPRWKAERKAHLEGYGWVDRSKGVVHIPIEQAMQLVASGASPAGAPQ